MAAIRIVQVLEATAGGTRRHLREVADALACDAFEVEIVCAVGRDPGFRADLERFRAQRHRVTELPMARGLRPLADTRAVQDLRRLLRRRRPDLVHLHSAKAGWLGRLAARGLGLPVLYSPHAFPFLQDDPAPVRRLYEWAERLAARWTTRLVAVSDAEAALAVERGLFPRDQIDVLANAVDREALDRSVGPLPPLREPGRRVFGLVGELRAQKAPELLLEATRRVRARGVGLRLALPTGGPLRRRVGDRVRRLGLTDAVEFVEADAGLEALYRRCDVAVLPSGWEGLPYTMLEALALGRTLITSDLAVFRQFVAPVSDDLLFARGDAAALADRLAHWARAPTEELERVAARARQAAGHWPDLADWGRGLRALYRKALG